MRVPFIATFVILCSTLSAQVPQAIKYQAVARDSTGSILANTNITVRVSIIDSAAGGNVAYSETHNASTNQSGVFSISIGRGSQLTGTFAGINWTTGGKWMQLEMSLDGGTTFELVSVSELLSVPYALYAQNALYAQTSSSLPDSVYFNPLYPDGTSGMTPVSMRLTESNYYVVPTGKNLHVIRIISEDGSFVPDFYATINGIDFGVGNNCYLILGAGDTIADFATPPALLMFGYLIDAKVTPVNVSLNNGAYVVPSGKKLFITVIASDDSPSPVITINGISSSWIKGATVVPMVLKSGASISTSAPTPWGVYLNGYLK